eukprot:11424761-Alexandrium_andersonii.AAC.1
MDTGRMKIPSHEGHHMSRHGGIRDTYGGASAQHDQPCRASVRGYAHSHQQTDFCLKTQHPCGS